MTKDQALKMGLCEKACGLYCGKAKKQVCDKFMSANGTAEDSKYCRLPQSDIDTMKREYGYNPKTDRIGR